ncbi:MAG: hypothetical protein ACJ8FY_02105 [Gemmataceae bacterium]
MMPVWIVCGWLIGSPSQTVAQSPPAPPSQETESAAQIQDTIRRLNERLDVLERDNAAARAKNARLEDLIRGRNPDAKSADKTAPPSSLPPLTEPSIATDSTPDVAPACPKSLADKIVEGLGTRYDNGFILVETPDKDQVPYKLWFNLFNQFRYLNQELQSDTFTDHLGNVRHVDSRNDLNVNRNLFYFQGFVFDPDLIFNAIIWSSNSVATVIQGGYIGYRFDKAFTLYAGYWGIPGSRTNTRNFMFLEGVERSMADNFFRPSFTQGVWAEGQLWDHLFYEIYVGNSLNTLNVDTTKIDRNMVYSGSTWWEPLGDYGPPGAARMSFSDLENHETPVVRIGTSMTGAREDRFSDLTQNTPDNSAVYNSDGVLFFSTGSLAPGVTVLLANYYMWAQDFGFKYHGFSFNAQYYLRWLNSFRADGPLPLASTFDHGFEASAGYFICPKKFEVYGRASAVFGEFGDSNEYAIGFNWHPWGNRGFRLTGEANHVESSPTNSIQTIYNSGMTGWNFVLQTQLYF